MSRQNYYPDELFYTVTPSPARRIDVPQHVIDRIYDAAYKGLRNESLAYASGITPDEFLFLCGANELAALAVKRGIADSQMDVANALLTNALNGDTKAAVAVLTHRHDWMQAKPLDDNSKELTITIVNAHPVPATTNDEPTGATISLLDDAI